MIDEKYFYKVMRKSYDVRYVGNTRNYIVEAVLERQIRED